MLKFCTPFSLILVALVFGFAGCTKYIEFEGDNATPRLVLNGVMLADSVISVTLSNSIGYLSQDGISRQTNGVVSLRDAEGNLIETLQHLSDGHYEGSTLAAMGATYLITAEHPGFEPVSASDRVPIPVPILSWDTSTVTIENPFESGDNLEWRFTFTDPPGEDNFYMIEVLQLDEYYLGYNYDPNTGETILDTIWFPEPILSTVFLSSNDQVLASENDSFLGESQVFGEQFFFSDNLFNGLTREFSLRFSDRGAGTSFRLRLTSLSHDYYRYRQTVRRFFNTLGDPFAEPVQVFSNVEGGLGILGSSSSSEVLID